uniref:Reverse transcriptase domain-containing protein n=1 Tax=Poecilia reticulata TaxID=8081 RepID=A0A3P9PAU0_POERE
VFKRLNSHTEPRPPVNACSLNAQLLFEAISGMKGGKSPRPDEIPIEIHKIFQSKLIIFQSKLIPPMLDMYQESFKKGSLPPSLNTAINSLLLKKGKPVWVNQCGLYRPISLINNDVKILCKVLARMAAQWRIW